MFRGNSGSAWTLSARYSNSRETDRRTRISLEHRLDKGLSIGFDYLPDRREVTPRANLTLGNFIVGTSSSRSSTFEGRQAIYGLARHRFGGHSIYGGPLVEFGGRLRAVAGGSLSLGSGFGLEPTYDGHFFASALTYAKGANSYSVHLTGTRRIGFSFSFGFD